MAGCVYCIDNDILKKLATFQLFQSTLELFEISYQDIKILDSAKYKFKKDWDKLQRGKNRNSSDKYVNWKDVLELTQVLATFSEIDINISIYSQLLTYDKQGINKGEALLASLAIAIIQKDESATIFTGDKVFIKALAQVDIPIVHEALKGRIWCLEQVILKNIEHDSFDDIRDQIVPVRDCDTAIKAVFGSGKNTEKEVAIATLKDYIDELNTPLIFPYSSSSSNP